MSAQGGNKRRTGLLGVRLARRAAKARRRLAHRRDLAVLVGGVGGGVHGRAGLMRAHLA